jgi:hypothetical protein
LTEKRAEDLIESKKDLGKGESPMDRPDIVRIYDRPDTLHVNDRPDTLRANDGADAPESEKRLDSKRVKKVQDEQDDLQAERGGLKVKDSDFKTK